MPPHRLTDGVIDSEAALRALIGEPAAMVCAKIADRLNELTRQSSTGRRACWWRRATDTFRVNGRATLTTDPRLLAPSRIEGKVPRLGIIVDIEQAYTQCSKAVLRSLLWDADRFVDPADLPTTGEIQRAIRDRRGDLGFDAATYDAERAERYARREGFY